MSQRSVLSQIAIAHPAMRACAAFLAVGLCLTSLQLSANREVTSESGLQPWNIVRNRYASTALSILRCIAELEFPQSLLIWLVLCESLADLYLLASAVVGTSLLIPIACAFFLRAAITLRVPHGSNGADRMLIVVLVAILLAECIPTHIGEAVALWFLCAHSFIAYAASGMWKLSEQGWYDGSYVMDLAATGAFGTQRIAALCRARPELPIVVGRAVIFCEVLFPLAILVPTKVLLGIITIVGTAHLCLGFVMGLNTFFWAFAATYPAILYCNLMLYSSI